MFLLHVLPIAAALMSVAGQQPPAPGGEGTFKPAEREVVSRFFRAVDEYVLARRLAAPRDPDALCLPEEFYEAFNGLAAPLDALPRPREGGIFSPHVADLFRDRLTGMLRLFEGTPLDLAVAANAEAALTVITIGEPVPKAPGRHEFAWLLATLPVLPVELEYRLIARNLVIVDVGAGIAVDVLRGALPVR